MQKSQTTLKPLSTHSHTLSENFHQRVLYKIETLSLVVHRTHPVTSMTTTATAPKRVHIIIDDDDEEEYNNITIMRNTQSGKTGIITKLIKEFQSEPGVKPVVFFITMNDRVLANQSAIRIEESLNSSKGCKSFILSSDYSVTIPQVHKHLSKYASATTNRTKMPLFTVLTNRHQLDKVYNIMNYIKSLKEETPELRMIAIFDEADSTYPLMKSTHLSLYNNFFKEGNDNNTQIIFASATIKSLLEYPECSNSTLWRDPTPSPMPHYRSPHHSDTISKINNDFIATKHEYALNCLRENLRHFTTPISPGNYRKVIINSGALRKEMETLATTAIEMNFYAAMVVNMDGVYLYRSGKKKRLCVQDKEEQFNEFLYRVYTKYDLDQGPIAIIGSRKVDRGITYHYVPSDGEDGLVWTDIILGKIKVTADAVQKAGRLAGHVAHCPSYIPGTYWAEQNTWNNIVEHFHVVDSINETKYNTYNFGETYTQVMAHLEEEAHRIAEEALEANRLQQINSEKLLKAFKERYAQCDKKEDCPVCLEPITCRKLALPKCGHLICTGCKSKINKCPICRGAY